MKKRYYIIYPLMILSFTVYLLISDTGLLEYAKWSEKNDSLKTTLDGLKEVNQNLEASIDSVQKKVPFKMEQVAREKYSMKKPNEKLIIVKPDN